MGREFVEHTVHIAVAMIRAEALGGLDGLVDHHAVRHIRAVFQLVSTHAQGRQFDGIDLRHFTVDEGLDAVVEFLHVLFHAAQDVLEILEVGDDHVLLVTELFDDTAHLAAADLPRVERLQGAATCARASGEVDAVRGCVVHLPSFA